MCYLPSFKQYLNSQFTQWKVSQFLEEVSKQLFQFKKVHFSIRSLKGIRAKIVKKVSRAWKAMRAVSQAIPIRRSRLRRLTGTRRKFKNLLNQNKPASRATYTIRSSQPTIRKDKLQLFLHLIIDIVYYYIKSFYVFVLYL